MEAKVRCGAVTTLGVTQTGDGRLKFNISEGEAIDAPILLNVNTSTHIRFSLPPAEYMDRSIWTACLWKRRPITWLCLWGTMQACFPRLQSL